MSNPIYNKHIISISDLSRSELELIVSTANDLKQNPRPDLLKNKVVASCFFEASTRTRLSFETAVQRLGGSVIGFPDSGNTSLGKKGETLADSVQVISSYCDAFFMRHNQEGAARLASEFSSAPVINGGDGSNQHPTQTLLDLFSIYETQGTLEKLQVAFVGDLKYGRTVHSLTQALSLFDCEFHFIAPAALSMPDYIIDELKAKGCKYTLHDHLDGVLPNLDILYMTRVQKERFDETEYQHLKSSFILNANMLEGVKENLKVLHPLPRIDEITTDVDSTPYAYYFQQAKNGVYARQALLALVLTNEFGDK
ncbi:aspartate carbamoyltransferase [Shewanella halifaxensis HAW-EB4]|uniref:Aspartate carbamoyltransferase catalytic subunit 3 n=1 Tax=Shewanella halifaxensis (strain HAW-EB4) TaxID=458817 RepID=PYRB3_SHEHH|nr:aspartate carbamoyltransferase [Shewanella halifaxensis]B0TPF3.1 RecName: Full=Aspartate carbamoyltransferase catalytic subunit 3; AltName: Full=Aspartate transcarbamylase 3; Short=ATCase 3 [Shewanella halifaxensis HAW-EB4]ABZ77600.1 aspartate carbamoyltransferase [Shewanella halifaxensis HAW-EB4]